ncbi:putative Lysine-specific metallo-endopeptidase domain-containing protein [Seiridium cardinale]
MHLHTLVIPALASLGLSESLQPRGWNFPDSSCEQNKQDIIKTEIGHAKDLSDLTVSNLEDGGYYETFFAKSLRDDPKFSVKADNVFQKISQMLDDSQHGFDFKITCDDTTSMCKDKYLAHMNDKKKTMNFCNRFFDTKVGILPTQDRLDKCDSIDLRAAQFSRSAIIVHECSHTSFAMDPEDRTVDYAYGFNSNYLLPLGKFDRSCAPYKKAGKIMCPDPKDKTKEGICDAELSAKNADTYSFIAAGVGYSKLCSRDIPLPAAPSSKLRRLDPYTGGIIQKRACNLGNDSIPFDDGPDE